MKMSNTEFKNRVYGCVVVKAINANYNADFSGLPRRLKSDGSFYATDKSFKWLVRNYIKKNYSHEKVLFTKVFDDKLNTMKLKEAFESLSDEKINKDNMKDTLFPKLLNFIDIRLFGAVFSPEGKKDNNISIHGNVQINHATDLYKKGRVYTDEILAPFTAIGSMSKATEAHYIHNFSVNPKNLSSWKNIFKKDAETSKQANLLDDEVKNDTLKLLSQNDIAILKNSFNNAATFYDSHSKAGVENELSIYVTLKETSTLTLPSLAQFIAFEKGKENESNSFDITKLINYLSKYKEQIESIDIYYIDELLNVINSSDKLSTIIHKHDLLEVLKVN